MEKIKPHPKIYMNLSNKRWGKKVPKHDKWDDTK